MKNKFFEIIGLITIIAFVSLACGSDSGGGNNGNTTYAITMEDNGNGSAEAIPNTAAEGDTVTISATPDNGYKFKEWESGSVTLSSNTATTATFTMPGNAVTIRAIFEEVDGPYLILSPIKFSDVEYNYSRPAAETITITNTGTETANVSDITFGGDAGSFEFTGYSSIISSTIAAGAGGNKAFNVQPIAGLDAGTYSATITVMYDDGETAINNVSFVVDKTNGAVISAPTLASKTSDSITILAVTPANGQTVEYGISKINDASTVSNWQTTLTFGSLNAGTTYYIFARAIANNNYNASTGTSLVVTLDSGSGPLSFEISSAEDLLKALSENGSAALSANYKLTADIDMTGVNWKPIGDFDDAQFDAYDGSVDFITFIGTLNFASAFTGSFDGNGFKIYNFTIYSTSDLQGLFGAVGLKGVVKNLGLENVDIKGKGGVGGITVLNFGTIEYCYVKGDVSCDSGDSGIAAVGGIAGGNYGGTIENCYATGDITGNDKQVGGIVGENFGTIENCYVTGKVVNAGNNKVGGIVGENEGTIKNCYATGDVSGNGEEVGGIAGSNKGTIENCYATGDVTGGDIQVGGIAGDHRGSIEYCVALNKNVASTRVAAANVGRVVGRNETGFGLSNNYARDDMTGSTFSNKFHDDIGGENISSTQYDSAAWWTGTAKWDSAIWDIQDNKLPTLKGFGGTQNPTIVP